MSDMSTPDDFLWGHNELIHQRDELIHQRDELIHQRDALIHERDKIIRERDGSSAARPQDPIPGILLNTLPKSASVFILETLANTLGKPVIAVSPGYFPHDQIDFRRLGALIESRGIAQSHLDASPFNQRYLKKLDKVIVQFRDPRQATLSWLHHLERLFREGQQDFLFTVTPMLPEDYFTFELARKIDYQLAHYLPQVIEWQMEWVTFIDQCNDPARFMLSSYEDFVVDSERYFTSLFVFLGCPAPNNVDVHSVLPTTARNFRKGEVDEWRSVFSEAQADLATAAIPFAIQARFGWSSATENS
jgi:hypothetical protein